VSLGTCLTELHARGLISEAAFARMRPRYEQLVLQYERAHGRAAAESMATARVLEDAEGEALQRKRQVLLQAQAQGRWLADMRGAAGDSAALGGRAAHDRVVAMDYARVAIRRRAHGMIEGLLARFRHDALGRVRERAELDLVTRELHGEDSGSLTARELAEAWRQTAEWLRSRFNAAGGAIGKLEGWALPQAHDSLRVMQAGFPAWRDVLLGRNGEAGLLDRGKMIDFDSGLPLADDKLDAILQDMWQAIATDGWSRREPGGIFAGAVANRRAQHRVLHFAGADAWNAYAARFGNNGSAFDAMLAHIEGMSRDIAAIEAMGPNPAATLRFQQDWLEKSAREAAAATGETAALDKLGSATAQLERLFDEYGGANNRQENRKLARRFSTFRSLQTAAKLGGAALSVGGDFGTTLLTARFNDLPAGKVLARYLSLMNPLNMADRRLAARLGAVSDEWGHMMAAAERLTGEELGGEVSRRLAQLVLKASGLSLHTEAARMAFGLEAMSAVTTARGHAYGNLDDGFRAMLGRYGIDEARWDALRQTPVREERGAEWIFPEDVADSTIADDVVRMIATESDYAIPMPDLRTRSFINANAPRGTWKGELLRSAFLFKGFPLTIINMHGRRLLDQPGAWNRTKYGLGLVLLTTAGGALSLQAKELAKGRDPQDMTSARFMAAAALQGGGLGIFGDLLASAENRFGGGIAQTLAGPGAQTVNTLGELTVGNAVAALDGDEDTETSVAKDAVNLLSHETPGVSLWYARLALDRLLIDTAKEWADGEGYAASVRRMEQTAAEQGTGYWAPPGARMGGRSPDWGNAIGQPSAPENVYRD
jgi:hypothetical protein